MSGNYNPAYDPTVPPSVSGVYPARYVGHAMIRSDGVTIVGWVTPPAALWTPEDLLWSPEGTKAIDSFGQVLDLTPFERQTWVTAQLDKRRTYLERLRELVLTGKVRLSAALAAMLGLDEDGVLAHPRDAGMGDSDGEFLRSLRAERLH